MTGDLGKKLDEVLKNPEMLAQIKALADTMTAGHSEEKAETDVSNDDAALLKDGLATLFHVTPSFQKSVKDTENLLNALRPFLDRQRQQKIDKMVSLLHVAEMAGNLGSIL